MTQTLNWAMGTMESLGKVAKVDEGNASVNIDGVVNYLVHIDLNADTLGAIARARPQVEIISDDERAIIMQIYGDNTI